MEGSLVLKDKEQIEILKKIISIKSRGKKVVAVSGGFDPIHVGHIRHLRGAGKAGYYLLVFLQPDEWLINKKGYAFMPYEERKEILENILWVDGVVPVIDKDKTVAKTLAFWKPSIFMKGGDRTLDNIPRSEKKSCKRNGIKLQYDNMGGKVQSSSWLVEKVKNGKA